MKHFKQLLLLFVAAFTIAGCTPKDQRTHFVLETDMGDIELVLYDETPLHRDNYIKLINENYFDGVLFHRVIKDFMIQSGDPNSKTAASGQMLGEGGPDYTIPAEFHIPTIFHKRGVLAAAREGNDVNPQMASAGSQFYIVWGKTFDEDGLDAQQKKIDERTGGTVKLTPEMREVYKTVGGTPHLDGQYTVFGEVVKGLDVVDAIQRVATDQNDRPVKDVRIKKARIL
jgi:cyclophilin family peptidyl-prolyl cis-trans isomerase